MLDPEHDTRERKAFKLVFKAAEILEMLSMYNSHFFHYQVFNKADIGNDPLNQRLPSFPEVFTVAVQPNV